MEKISRAKGNNYHGSKWIRRDKRLAIYLRDGMACVWCGHAVEDGAQLSLDHLKPHSQGGSNHENNLVTCCSRCNSSRADRPVEDFSNAVAHYLNKGITPKEITDHIKDCLFRDLQPFRRQAKAAIERRGSYRAVMAGMQ